MWHGNAFLRFLHEAATSIEDQPRRQHQLADGDGAPPVVLGVGVRTMFSWSRRPLRMQLSRPAGDGRVVRWRLIHDRQHPHDF